MQDEFTALDLYRINGDLVWTAGTRQPFPVSIPTCRVLLSRTPQTELAVLSWRWDIDPDTLISNNIALAVRHCKQRGVRYLLLDQVSLDNSLTGSELLTNVVEFAKLYRSLPVVAAYDDPHFTPNSWHYLIRRPWIVHEVKAWLGNPTSVDYVGYVAGQGQSNFRRLVENLWDTDYAHSILYVLTGQAGMTDIADFRFIMPEYAELIQQASQELSRNDYLLTVAILDQSGDGGLRLNSDHDIRDIKFDRYRFGGEIHGVAREIIQPILLDGKKVAAWSTDDGSNFGVRVKMYVEPDSGDTILKALGVTGEYRLGGGGRRSPSGGAVPQFRVYFSDPKKGTLAAVPPDETTGDQWKPRAPWLLPKNPRTRLRDADGAF
ncbi:MAG: hypothetical protein JO267_05530 [Alphaproteobacteria bacterium]|nr:hypothetical protein [Alphaproteobacteria bacterium]